MLDDAKEERLMKLYEYVGPEHLRELAHYECSKCAVRSPEDLLAWSSDTLQRWERGHSLTVTFVIDREGCLWVSDRHSEHVACAAGEPVLSAGEMTFYKDKQSVEVEMVSNQSTGYCPEPSSWPAVSSALERAGFEAPVGFSYSFTFRRCPECDSINLVKEEQFVCAVCRGTLPQEWNVSTRYPQDS